MNRTIAFIPLLLLSACGAGGGSEEGGAKPDPVASVRTGTAVQAAANEQVVVYGVADAGPGAVHTLVAPAETIIDRIVAPNGTPVRAGQTIALLRPSRTTAADLAKATADAASADAAYARAKRLRADGLASDADVETARTAAETAKAMRASFGGSLVLRAPVAGIVQGLAARPGDQVAAGTAVATILGKGDLRARFGIDPMLVARVRPGQALRLDDLQGTGHTSVTVAGIDKQLDPATRLASIYASVPQGFGLAPGEAVRGSLALAERTGGLSIPYAALLDDGGRSYVFVVKNGVAHETGVLPGNSTGDRIEVLNGLAAGDKVVTEGGTGLEDGMKVIERGAAQ